MEDDSSNTDDDRDGDDDDGEIGGGLHSLLINEMNHSRHKNRQFLLHLMGLS